LKTGRLEVVCGINPSREHGAASPLKFAQAVKKGEMIVAIELMFAVQGLDFFKPLRFD
jgi:histidine ammonia-lyase